MAAGKGAREEEPRTRTTHVRRWRQIRQQRGEGGGCRVPGTVLFVRVTAPRRAMCAGGRGRCPVHGRTAKRMASATAEAAAHIRYKETTRFTPPTRVGVFASMADDWGLGGLGAENRSRFHAGY